MVEMSGGAEWCLAALGYSQEERKPRERILLPTVMSILSDMG